MPVVGCLTVAAGILARSEGVSKGTGTDQRFVKNALKNAELPPDSFKYLFFFYFCHIHASLFTNHNLVGFYFACKSSIRDRLDRIFNSLSIRSQIPGCKDRIHNRQQFFFSSFKINFTSSGAADIRCWNQ